MAEEGRQSVTLPLALLERVRRVVEVPGLGYDSMVEFVRAAIREKLEVEEERAAMLAEVGGAQKLNPSAKR